MDALWGFWVFHVQGLPRCVSVKNTEKWVDYGEVLGIYLMMFLRCVFLISIARLFMPQSVVEILECAFRHLLTRAILAHRVRYV